MSTEQRDKAAEEFLRDIPRGYNDRAYARVGFEEGWDAHAATMPNQKTLIELLESSQHAPMETHDRGNGECLVCPVPLRVLGSDEIADAVLALLDKED